MQDTDAQGRMAGLPNYYDWVFQLVRPYVGRRVLDAGAGVGHFAALVEPDAEYLMAVDFNPDNLEQLRQRFSRSTKVAVSSLDLAEIGALGATEIDTVVCLDVLEHVEDDVGLLSRFLEIVSPGGHLVIKVPACPSLYCAIDEVSGHYRRYTSELVAARARQAGWQPIVTRYMNFAGVFPYWLKGLRGAQASTFSQSLALWQLDAINRLVPLLRRFDRLIGPPVGLSAILIASKRAG